MNLFSELVWESGEAAMQAGKELTERKQTALKDKVVRVARG